MEINKPIAEMNVNDEVEGFYVLSDASAKTTATGKPYLAMSLSDASGEIDAKVWDYGGPIGEDSIGKIIKIRGSVSEYRGYLQLTVERIRMAGENDKIDFSALVPTAPVDIDAEFEAVKRLVCSIEDEDYRKICELMLEKHKNTIRNIPAAKSVHHSFLSGLLMHTANMMKTADFFAGLYSSTVDRSLLLAGTFLHDIGKETEFCFSELGLVTEYSVKGQLLGHLVIGAQEVARLAEENEIDEEKSVLLQHMLLSHHGEPQFGAAVRPACAESELLSYIDMIDSRMEIYREEYECMGEGEISGRIFALDRRIYKHF